MLKVAIIGCGRIGLMLEEDELRDKPATHAGAYLASRFTKIVAVADINSKRLKYAGQKLKLPEDALYTDYKKLLKEQKPDIVSIATWTEQHHEMVMECTKISSVKGIYCEKPIAQNLHHATQMINACRKKNIKLLINHERRFEANFHKVKSLIDSGRLGKLKTIIAQSLSGTPPKLTVKKYTGGTLFHDGTHMFDMVRFFGGDVKWVIGYDKRPYGEDYIESSAGGVAELKDGAKLLFEGGGERKYYKFDLDLQLERGRVIIGNSGFQIFRAAKSKKYGGFMELEQVPYSPPKNWQSPFKVAVMELVHAIKEDREPISSGDDGKKSLELILATYKSAAENSKKIYMKN